MCDLFCSKGTDTLLCNKASPSQAPIPKYLITSYFTGQYLSSNETIALLNWAKLTTETYTEEKPKTVEDLVKETMENK